MKSIGPSFGDEIRAAGLAGLPFSWGSDGVIQFDSRMTQVKIDAVNAVYTTHNPTAVPTLIIDPIDELRAALKTDPALLDKIKLLK